MLRSDTRDIDGHRWTFIELGGSAFYYRPMVMGLIAALGEGFVASGEAGAARAICDRMTPDLMRQLCGLLLEGQRGDAGPAAVVEVDGKSYSWQAALADQKVSQDECMEALAAAMALSFGPFSGLVDRFRRVVGAFSKASTTSATGGPSSG